MADVNEIVSKAAIKGVERLGTATKQTAKQVQALYDVSKKLDTVMKGLDLSTKNAKKNQETLSNAQKQAIKINKEQIQIRKKVNDLENESIRSLMRKKQGLQQATNETKKAIEVERSKTAAWKKSQKATEQSTVSLKKNKQIIKLQATANAAAKGSYDKLAAQLSLNIAKYKALSAAQQKASKGQTLIKNIQKQDAALKKLDKTMGRSQRNVGNYGAGFTKAFAKVGLAIAGVVAAWRTLQRVIGGSIEVFKIWETGQANVQTLLDKTDKTLEGRSIALMKKHGLAVDDLNKALFDAVSAGIESGKAVDFLDKASVLAIAGVTDLASSVDGITSILNAYGLEVSETDKITAAFFSAQKFGKTTVAELTQEVGRTAPVAKLAGLSYQELLSTYAELTKQGIKTVDATTAIKATILAVIKPSEIARKKFNELGIEVGANAVKQQGLMSILQKVSAAAKTDADALTELIPNVRALTGVGALGTEALKDYDKILKIVNEDYGEGSSMAKGYAIQSETLTKKTDKFNATIRVLSIAFGAKLKPILIEFIGVAESVGSWFTKNLKTILAVVKIVSMATGAWLLYKGAMFAWSKGTLLVNAITVKSAAFQKAYTAAVGNSTGVIKKAIAIQKALKLTMAATPWGAIAVAIGLIVGALIVFSKRASAAEKAQKALNDINAEARKSVAGQRVEMDLLLATAKDTEASYAMRNDAIKKLNEISPEYLGNLKLETINSDEAKIAINHYTDALLENARAIVERTKLEEIARKRSDIELGQTKVKIGLWGNVKVALAGQASMYVKTAETIKATASELESLDILENEILANIKSRNKEKSESVKLDETSITEGKKATAEEIANLEKIAAAKKRLETVGQKVDINEIKRAGTERLIELQTQLQNESITQKEFNELKAESTYDTNIKILEQETAFIVKALDNKLLGDAERLDLEDQLTGKLLESQKLFSDEALRIAKENKDEILQAELLANQAAIEAAQQKANDANAAITADLLFQKQRYAQGIIDKKEYEAIIAQLEKDKNLKIIEGDISVMQTQKDILAKQLKNSKLLPEQKKKINDELVIVEENLTQLQMDLSDEVTDHQIENIDKVAAAQKKVDDEAAELAQLKHETKMMLGNATFEFGQMIGEKQLMNLEIEKQRELDVAGDNAEQKARIEEKYGEKVAKIKRRQALLDKAQALFNIAISTAVNIVKASATPLLIPWIIAMGATSAALVIARPVPKFAKGVKSSPAGPAEVGEKGRELGVTPKGQAFIADEKQVVNLEKGTRIFNNKETEKILNTNTGNLGYDMSELNTPTGYNTLTAFNEMYTQLDSEGIIAAIGEGNEALVDAIKRKRELHIYPSKRKIIEREGRYFKEYLNTNFLT